MEALPEPRGALSAALLERLASPPGPLDLVPSPADDPAADEDVQLALTLCYELHYRGLPGVDERWEWEPSLLALRRTLEDELEAALRDAVPPQPVEPGDVAAAVRALADEEAGPSLSGRLRAEGTLEQYREFAVHRSIYQLKEADPHSWAIPRLSGRAKGALVEIQADEYGGGRPERIHAALFAKTMRGLGLDDRYGAYLDHVPALTLATVNVISMFGLHRRLRGALVGQLALFETTSSVPNARYADGLRRLGVDDEDTLDFFDEHVEADAVHEAVATVDLAGGLAADEPALAADIVWGAAAFAHLEARWSGALCDAWDEGRSSLRRALEQPLVAA